MSLAVDYKKTSSKDEAFSSVREVITPEYISKFKVKADVDYDESDKIITATGKGFTLVFSFDESQVGLDLKLSLMLKPLRGQIEGMMVKELKKVV